MKITNRHIPSTSLLPLARTNRFPSRGALLTYPLVSTPTDGLLKTLNSKVESAYKFSSNNFVNNRLVHMLYEKVNS